MTSAVAHIDLLTLKLFVTVADEGSIAKAAWRENITTSAISKRISDLENHFGSTLLIRHHQGVAPTAAGNALLPHCRALLSRLGQIEDELRDYRQGVRGLIRLAANETAALGYLPQDITSFVRNYPEAKVDLQVETSPVVVRKVTENAADIGLFTGSVPTGDLQVIPYRMDRLVAMVPADHPLASRSAIAFRELLDLNFIGSEADGAIEMVTLRAASDAGRSLRTRIRVNSFDAACRFVAGGLGTTIVTTALAQTATAVLPITALQIEDAWAVRELFICLRQRDQLPQISNFFLEHISRP